MLVNKKIVFIATLSAVVLVALLFIFFYTIGVGCVDGQGFTMYIPKDSLMKNLASAHGAYLFSVVSSLEFIGQTETNPCGIVTARIIVENGKQVKVGSKEFDAYVADYNKNCGGCLMRLNQAGNSPVFVKDLSSGLSYSINNFNGTFSLQQLY